MFRTLIATVLAVFALNAFAAADVNQASQAELEALKGIGPGLASKILTARQSAPFKDWQDLVDRVGGIGAGNAAKLSQAGLTVAGAAFNGQLASSDKATAPKKEKKAKADKAEKAEKADKAAA